jgi:hypothetical protein
MHSYTSPSEAGSDQQLTPVENTLLGPRAVIAAPLTMDPAIGRHELVQAVPTHDRVNWSCGNTSA